MKGAPGQFMNERVVPKKTNFYVVKPGNSPAKADPINGAQPMSEASALAAANALGLARVPRLGQEGLAHRHFESQPDSPRINHRLGKVLGNAG